MVRILLIGPQGSGKSTQGKLLERILKVPYISTGDIFREIASSNTEEGKEVKKTIESGQLMDDQTTSTIVQKRLEGEDYKKGFIIDGYPRNLEQLRLFDPKVDKVFYLNVADQLVLERLLKRGRADDSQDSIKTRLDLYHRQIQPLLDNYKNQGILVEVDGKGSVEDVQKKIREVLNG